MIEKGTAVPLGKTQWKHELQGISDARHLAIHSERSAAEFIDNLVSS
jgi:hypothetical protein